jgi:hypothetical protein
MDTIEKHYIYGKTIKANQSNDKHRVAQNKSFETILQMGGI